MKRTSWIVMTLAAGLAVSAAAQCPMGGGACGGQPGPRRAGGSMLQMLVRQEARLRELGATDEQIQKLKTIAYAVRKDMISLMAEREQAELDLQRLMDQPKLDRAAIEKLADQMGSVEARTIKQRLMTQADIRELFGTDLLKQLRRDRPRGEDRREGRMPNKEQRRGRGRNFERPDRMPEHEAMPGPEHESED
mgnify:CR=1 FL=1